MSRRKKVSVCIATFNGAKYLYKQINSILLQMEEQDEIIISDDSSTDNTLHILKSFNDKRIKIYPNQAFKNPIFNFENALKNASGDYILLADQDDIWVAGKVEAFINAFQNYDMVVSDHVVFNEEEIVYKSFFELVPSKPGIVHNLKKNTYYGCCMGFKREILKKALPFPKDIPMHDIWLGFVSDIYFKSTFINYPYTLYRKHGSNVSNATEIYSGNTIWIKIKNRINIIKYLPLLLTR
ncbi:MAG: glycosyltransferase [Sphingobacteriales bacterium]|nr:glycosyltransferase [Sphingobacteriales bacterium]